jgi:hypothetical protein
MRIEQPRTTTCGRRKQAATGTPVSGGARRRTSPVRIEIDQRFTI